MSIAWHFNMITLHMVSWFSLQVFPADNSTDFYRVSNFSNHRSHCQSHHRHHHIYPFQLLEKIAILVHNLIPKVCSVLRVFLFAAKDEWLEWVILNDSGLGMLLVIFREKKWIEGEVGQGRKINKFDASLLWWIQFNIMNPKQILQTESTSHSGGV